MEWSLFWTVLAQVAIGSLALAVLSLPLRFAVFNLTAGIVREPRPQSATTIYTGDANGD